MKPDKYFQNILGHMRRADQNFDLIRDGDKIAVGLSGGKDSLTLLKALCAYQKFGIKNFTVMAITVDCAGDVKKYSDIEKFCESLGVEYHIEPSQIFDIIFNVRKEINPCSLCSKLRRGMLNSAARTHNCNKVALAHHGDDLIETFLLSMLYEGRLSTFSPKSYLDRTDVTVIRPFIFVTEAEIVAASRGMPILENPCPINHKTRREYMKNLVAKLDGEVDGARARMLDAIISVDRYNLPGRAEDIKNREGASPPQ